MSVNVVSTVLASAATYDLTDLSSVKLELSLKPNDTSNDTWIGTKAIPHVSKTIANACNRVFPPEQVQDVFNIRRDRYQVPAGVTELQLSRWPILAVTSVVQLQPTLGTTRVLVEGTDFRANGETGELLRLDPALGTVIAWEALPVTVIYVAGFGEMQLQAVPVPASSPYTVNVTEAAAFSCDNQVAYADGAALARVDANPAAGQYSAASGVYTFNSADAGKSVIISYAVLDVPPDVEDAALQLITGRFRSRGRDPALIQRDTPNVGTERWWFGPAPGQVGGLPPEIADLLDNYHVPVAG